MLTWYLRWEEFRVWKTFFEIVVNIRSLLFQKGTKLKHFAIFFSFLHFPKPILVLWPCCIYLCSSPEQCATFVRSGFFIWRLEKFFETLEVAPWGTFSVLFEYILCFSLLYILKSDKNRSLLPYNHFFVSYDALICTKRFLWAQALFFICITFIKNV